MEGIYASAVEVPPQAPRDLEIDKKAEAAVGLAGIGEVLQQYCVTKTTNTSSSIYLAAVSNSGDDGIREMVVFCAGQAGDEPDVILPTRLASQISVFLREEDAVAQDLRIYAEALDPATADVVGKTSEPNGLQEAKLLRIFCRYAASRLGRALEVISAAAEDGSSNRCTGSKHQLAAQRMIPQLDVCRWKWWRAAVRFS